MTSILPFDLPVLYHGTSRHACLQNEDGLPLHLTSDRESAIDYAKDRVESDAQDYDEGEAPADWLEPVLVEFSPHLIGDWVRSGMIQIRPTAGFEELEQPEDPTDWVTAFKQQGALRLEGFSNAMKPMGMVTPIEPHLSSPTP